MNACKPLGHRCACQRSPFFDNIICPSLINIFGVIYAIVRGQPRQENMTVHDCGAKKKENEQGKSPQNRLNGIFLDGKKNEAVECPAWLNTKIEKEVVEHLEGTPLLASVSFPLLLLEVELARPYFLSFLGHCWYQCIPQCQLDALPF